MKPGLQSAPILEVGDMLHGKGYLLAIPSSVPSNCYYYCIGGNYSILQIFALMFLCNDVKGLFVGFSWKWYVLVY